MEKSESRESGENFFHFLQFRLFHLSTFTFILFPTHVKSSQSIYLLQQTNTIEMSSSTPKKTPGTSKTLQAIDPSVEFPKIRTWGQFFLYFEWCSWSVISTVVASDYERSILSTLPIIRNNKKIAPPLSHPC
jgi:hypothetical protein